MLDLISGLGMGLGLMKQTLAATCSMAVDQALAVDSHHILILGLGMGLGLMKQTLAVDQALAHAPLAHAWLLMVIN